MIRPTHMLAAAGLLILLAGCRTSTPEASSQVESHRTLPADVHEIPPSVQDEHALLMRNQSVLHEGQQEIKSMLREGSPNSGTDYIEPSEPLALIDALRHRGLTITRLDQRVGPATVLSLHRGALLWQVGPEDDDMPSLASTVLARIDGYRERELIVRSFSLHLDDTPREKYAMGQLVMAVVPGRGTPARSAPLILNPRAD